MQSELLKLYEPKKVYSLADFFSIKGHITNIEVQQMTRVTAERQYELI